MSLPIKTRKPKRKSKLLKKHPDWKESEFTYRGLKFRILEKPTSITIKQGKRGVLIRFTLPSNHEQIKKEMIESIVSGVDKGRGLNIDYSKRGPPPTSKIRHSKPKKLSSGGEMVLELHDYGYQYEVALYVYSYPDGQIVNRWRGLYFTRPQSAHRYFDKLLDEESLEEEKI